MICPLLRPGPDGNVTGFRWKLLVSVGLVVAALTALGVYLAERRAEATVENDFEHEFQGALAALRHVQELRQQEIAGRCDALVRNPRIHAALEDDALDLLYFNARDGLHDLVYTAESHPEKEGPAALRACYYRFLDARGAIIQPPAVKKVGELTALEEQQLAVAKLPDKQEIAYLIRTAGPWRGAIIETTTVPIRSSESGEIISALMVGFEPINFSAATAGPLIRRGVWVGDALHMPGLGDGPTEELAAQVRATVPADDGSERRLAVRLEGAPHLAFAKRINPGSVFPPAYEVCVYPLADSLATRRRLRWQIIGAGLLVLAAGLAASHYLSQRFAAPVERLATDSAENAARLEATSRELQRSARFSADASHQLKTPVTVLRAGLEEVLARDHLPDDSREEISALIHQTYRLNGIIEDLLLLSRMDAGRLRLEIGEVDLAAIIEGWLDDLSALPDPLNLDVSTALSSPLCIAGEARYVNLIVQNLLENARKYNRPGGRMDIDAEEDSAGNVRLVIGNTGPGIDPAAREHIFERFHRGNAGENVPGHGLGLNLARELARLHGGDLRLVRSEDDWTEFEASFRAYRPDHIPAGPRS